MVLQCEVGREDDDEEEAIMHVSNACVTMVSNAALWSVDVVVYVEMSPSFSRSGLRLTLCDNCPHLPRCL